MRILAVKPSSEDITIAIVAGSKDAPTLIKLDKEVYKPSFSEDPARDLYATENYFNQLIKKENIDMLLIVKAVKPQKGSVSVERVKNEAAVQLAAAAQGIPAKLIAPQTIRAAEKKYSHDLSIVLNRNFKSKDKQEVAFLGIMGLGG
jgi:hypothetical protein